MTGMRTIRYNSDSTTTYECPVCLKRETAYENGGLIHEPGGLACLQRQVTALQEEVASLTETVETIEEMKMTIRKIIEKIAPNNESFDIYSRENKYGGEI